MKVNGIAVDDTFAEAFGMSATGVIITADSMRWARQAAVTMSGFGTSVIGAGAEVGIDRELKPDETPDGRPGVRVLLFGFSPDAVGPQLKNRVGQCVLTSPGSACYAGVESEKRIGLGQGPRYFGDGFQTAKRLGDKRYWRVPVMDGEFVIEETTGDRHRRGRRRQRDYPRQRPRRPAGDGRGRRRCHRQRARRHHAVPGRHRALGLQGRLQVQGRGRLDQRRLLPDVARPREVRAWSRHRRRARDRHRRPDLQVGRRLP